MVNQTIDIVTVTYGNMFSVVRRTVDSLYKFTEQPFRLIIVNNGSTDETATFFSQLRSCTLINLGENTGMVNAFDAGIKKSSGPFVAIMDHDIEFTMPWKEEFLKLFDKNRDVGVIGPRIVMPDNRIYSALFSFYFQIPRTQIKFAISNPIILPRFLRRFVHFSFHHGEQDNDSQFAVVKKVPHVTGCFLVARKETFQKTGGFVDKSYLDRNGAYVDLDFTLRVLKSGYKILYDGKTKIIHHCNRPPQIVRDSNSQQNYKRLKKKWGI